MAELELKKIKVLNELTAVADEDLLAVVDDPTGVSETKAITRGNLLGSTIISTDLGMASKTAGAALPIQKNSIIASDVQLTGSTADGFPNTTTTYIWNIDSDESESQTDIINSKALTVVAGELESATDVLGNTKFCKWSDGDTYLQSTDAAFNVENAEDTDDFMVGGWFSLPDWTPAVASALITNNSVALNTHGYGFYVASDGVLSAGLFGGSSVSASINVGNLAANTFHHIVFAREVGVAGYLFLDGVLVATCADNTIGTTQSKFQLGGSNGANYLPEDGTCYDEVFFRKGVLPTNLDDVVRNIYARSAKKFAVKSQDGGVKIDGKTGVAIKRLLSDNFTKAGEINGDDLGLSAVVPESGWYLCSAMMNWSNDNAAETGYILLRYSSLGGVNMLAPSQKAVVASARCQLNGTTLYYIQAGTTIHQTAYISSAGGTTTIYSEADVVGGQTGFILIKVAE